MRAVLSLVSLLLQNLLASSDHVVFLNGLQEIGASAVRLVEAAYKTGQLSALAKTAYHNFRQSVRQQGQHLPPGRSATIFHVQGKKMPNK